MSPNRDEHGTLSPDKTVPVPRLGLRVRNVRGTILLAWQETFLELADVAGFLWRQLDGVRTVDELVSLVAAEYEADPAEVAEDVQAVLADLVQAGFIALRSTDEPIRNWY